jgi:4-hydroxy-3-methylbut-2-enyl diphosphate reductase
MGRITVHLAEESGFCFGVRRAIDLSLRAAEKEGQVATDGDLVHNQHVLDTLRDKGVVSLTKGERPHCAVLIRAHGVTTHARQELIDIAPRVIDATCPMVATIKKQVDRANDTGALVLIVGKSGHPEAIGLKDDRDDVVIVDNAKFLDSDELKKRIVKASSVALFAQSTTLQSVFADCEKNLLALRPEALIKNTICSPTQKRQAAVEALAKTVPLVVVVGDPRSANTAHLVEMAERYTRAIRVEGPNELDEALFENISEVGVTAGASTPDDVIQAVISRIEQIA